MAAQVSTVFSSENCKDGSRVGQYKHAASHANNQVTLDDVKICENRAHIALAEGLEFAKYEVELPEEEKVTLDEMMLHQNRVLHNEG
uniref:Uncharacterized protein n=1 Tax=Plectus sambesii TaxID=2011161 RepID=A0A914XCM9_9BILA